ncbi:AEC family transporter [Candidatus Epulonipiscium viviparus]|uniref:AEC family transporter n=1 Tax=Candidatus Epulonipiscium viviparus TaxID=420336 RepID=UPI0027380B24|nr:AEC family transporter [Candidatus Epulopiscium viviparus]
MLTNFIVSLNAIAPLFILIAIGYILKRIGKVDEAFVKQANYIVFKVSLPMTLFDTVYAVDIEGFFDPHLIAYATIALIAVATVMFFVTPKFIAEPTTAASFAQSSFRGNFVLLGSVLSLQLFGPAGSLPTISLIPVVVPVIMVLSIIVLRVLSQDAEAEKVNIAKVTIEIVTNPVIVGILAAILCKTLDVTLPAMATTSINYLGTLATPLALIALGVQLQFKGIEKFGLVLACTAIKLIAVPLLVLTPAYFIGFTSYEMGALFILFSAPAGISNYALAYSMKCDYEFTGHMVVVSTLSSLVTMIAGIMIFKTLEVF